MKLWANLAGKIVEYDRTGRYTPTREYPRTFEFDDEPNALLVEDILEDLTLPMADRLYTVRADGFLYKSGVKVVVAEPGPRRQRWVIALLLIQKMRGGETLTAEEQRAYNLWIGEELIRQGMATRADSSK